MGQLAEFRRSPAATGNLQSDSSCPPVRTSDVYVVFTSVSEMLAAIRVANHLARALTAPLTLIHFRTVPYGVQVDQPAGDSPVETDRFLDRLTSEGLDVRVRVYLCRDPRGAIPLAFRRHSLIVLGGRRRWWPTRSAQLRRALEAAGHFVVFVDEARHA